MSFTDFCYQVYENSWTGLTPVWMVAFFILGLELGGWTAGYMNMGFSNFVLKYMLPIIFALAVPVTLVLKK